MEDQATPPGDEGTLHRVHVLIPARGWNKYLTCPFYKIVIVAEIPVDESVSISCNVFVRNIFVGLNFNYFSLRHTWLVRVYCSEHDPIYLILAEKFCFTIVKIKFYQQNYFTKRKLIVLGNFGWFLIKNIANAAINAKFHVSMVDSCSIIDTFWNVVVITERYTKLKYHLIQEHYSVHIERPNQARPQWKVNKWKVCKLQKKLQNLCNMHDYTLGFEDALYTAKNIDERICIKHIFCKYGHFVENSFCQLKRWRHTLDKGVWLWL